MVLAYSLNRSPAARRFWCASEDFAGLVAVNCTISSERTEKLMPPSLPWTTNKWTVAPSASPRPKNAKKVNVAPSTVVNAAPSMEVNVANTVVNANNTVVNVALMVITAIK